MAVKVLDGKALAARLAQEQAGRVREITAAKGRPPGLGVLLVGEDPGSAVYVRNKERRATEAGMLSRVVRLPASASQAEVLAAVDALNGAPEIDAFLVQLPLPKHIDAGAVTLRIAPAKDADGLHPVSMGRLVAGMPGPRPCTPAGVVALLDAGGVQLAGARAVVVGRSAIVGKPMAMLLLERDATVTVAHSRTQDLPALVAQADVLVAAVGRPELIQGAWIKPGAAVIDVGINRVGKALVGDVAFAAAAKRAAAITPVPGGVGPMTIAMLLHNTIEAAARPA
ncbi:MAG TPA: bifunctional methylenetetrahydrofolate dehydrogenase/methenyltetrahydrofolate cyclohydrolase FolD [Myxococcota bacterium]|nr:bifunctional methylenetetrahydrofolate dehydrogenase/methenyltetrahydrofolate cyclohydrolase FolD [Myxococcota bacterium]